MENTKVIVGPQIEEYAIAAAIQAMKLWIKGLRSRHHTPKTIAMRFKLKPGSAKSVLAQLEAKRN